LIRGREYLAHFAFASDKIASSKALYFRVGNEYSSVMDPGFVTGGWGTTGSLVYVGKSYGQQCSLPVSYRPQYGTPQGIWPARQAMDTAFLPNFYGVQDLGYGIKVSENYSGSSLSVYWHAKVTDSNGKLYSIPAGVPSMFDSCAPVDMASIPIDSCGVKGFACCAEGEPCNPGSYCDPADSKCKDVGTRIPNIFDCPFLKLNLSTGAYAPMSSCDTITFKVDSLFPADAIPIDVRDASGAPTPNYGMTFVDKNNPGRDVTDCFSYGAGPGGKALRYWPTKNCPYKPVGNKISSAEFIMNISSLPDTGKRRTIEIRVENETSMPFGVPFEAIDASYTYYKDLPRAVRNNEIVPLSYYGKDAEEINYKLFPVYVLNNRQLKADSDDLYAGTFNGGTFKNVWRGTTNKILGQDDNRGSVRLFAWDLDYWKTIACGGAACGNVPLDIHASNAVSKKILQIPQTPLPQGIGPLVTSKGGSVHGNAIIFDYIVEYAGRNSTFRRAYSHPESPPRNASDLDYGSPYKYFVANTTQTPVRFSVVFTETAEKVYHENWATFPAYSVELVGFGDTMEHCMVRQGIYQLTTTSSDGITWKYSATNPFGLIPLKLDFQSNANNCARSYACNLFDAFYGNASLYKGVAGSKHCLDFEWPIVPDGKQVQAQNLDLRGRDFAGIDVFPTSLWPFSFSILGNQTKSLTSDSIVYNWNTEFGQINPYRIDENYPEVFPLDWKNGQCANGQIQVSCICGGQVVATPSSQYCCNNVLRDNSCETYASACTPLGPTPESGQITLPQGCMCNGALEYSGYCCSFGTGLGEYFSDAGCTNWCSEGNQASSTCLCGGSPCSSGNYCCGGACQPDVCTAPILLSNPGYTAQQTSATITWDTNVETSPNAFACLNGDTCQGQADMNLGTHHSVTLTGLIPGHGYEIMLTSFNSSDPQQYNTLRYQFPTQTAPSCPQGSSCSLASYCVDATHYAQTGVCNAANQCNPLTTGGTSCGVYSTCPQGYILDEPCTRPCIGAGVCGACTPTCIYQPPPAYYYCDKNSENIVDDNNNVLITCSTFGNPSCCKGDVVNFGPMASGYISFAGTNEVKCVYQKYFNSPWYQRIMSDSPPPQLGSETVSTSRCT
jgi:hypothetical protein